jgi:hypothetical protein
MEVVLDGHSRRSTRHDPVLCLADKPSAFLGEGAALGARLFRVLEDGGNMQPPNFKDKEEALRKAGFGRLILLSDPASGWMSLKAFPERRGADVAHMIGAALDGECRGSFNAAIVPGSPNLRHEGIFHEGCKSADAFALNQRARLIRTPGKGAWMNIAERGLSRCAWLAQSGGKLAAPRALAEILGDAKARGNVAGGDQTRWLPARKMAWSLTPRLHIAEPPEGGGKGWAPAVRSCWAKTTPQG